MRHIDPTGYIGPEPTPIELISAMGTNTVAAVIIAAVAIPLWSRRHLWARTASVLLTAGVLGAAVAVARTLITATNQMDALSYITPMAVLGAAGLCRVFWTRAPARQSYPLDDYPLENFSFDPLPRPTISASVLDEPKDLPMKQAALNTTSPLAVRWVL